MHVGHRTILCDMKREGGLATQDAGGPKHPMPRKGDYQVPWVHKKGDRCKYMSASIVVVNDEVSTEPPLLYVRLTCFAIARWPKCLIKSSIPEFDPRERRHNQAPCRDSMPGIFREHY